MRRVLSLVCAGVLFSLGQVAAGEVTAQEKVADWRKASEIVAKLDAVGHRDAFERNPLAYTKAFLEAHKEFSAFWATFKERYGEERDTVDAAFKGIDQPLDVKEPILSLLNSFYIANDTMTSLFNTAKETGAEQYRKWQNGKDKVVPEKVELYFDYIRRAKECYEAAQLIDPKADVSENLKMATEACESWNDRFVDNLKTLEWPTNNPEWKGNDSAGAMCDAALAFVQKYPDYRGDAYGDDLGEPLAAVLVSDDWQAWQKDILGNPTQYLVDFKIAYASKKNADYAYLFHYSFYTKNEGGVAKSLPFAFANPHQYAHYIIYRSRVVHGGSGAAGAGSSGTFGLLFRLALAAGLILCGLFASSSLVAKIGQAKLDELLAKLKPVKGTIGGILFLLAAALFLRNTVLHFAPFADILPQVVAAATGLLMGFDFLVSMKVKREGAPAMEAAPAGESPAPASAPADKAKEAAAKAADLAGNAAEKAQAFLRQNQDRIRKLEQIQEPLGIACLVLGVLHLLCAGWWLL